MSKSTKTTQENKPPAWATPLFTKSAEDALNLYNSGTGGRTYMGSTVAPLSGTTMQGVNQLANAGANWDTGQTRGLFSGIGAESVNDPFVNRLSGVANTLSGPSYSERNLADMASGKYLKEGNPYFNQRLEGQLADTAAQTRSLYSGMGRGNSGVENRVLTDRIGGLRTEALAQDWDRNLAAMLGANQQMDASKLGFATAQGNMLSNAGTLRGQGLDRALTSTNAMAGLDQRNFENRLAGADAALKAGGIVDNQAQRLLSDEVAKFYALDNQDWTRLGMLQSAAAGAAGPYGTQVAQSRQPFGIGSLLGGLGSLGQGLGAMGKSDVRAKERIALIGEANGIPLYEFSYRGEDARWIGTMAQAIPMHRSAALYVDNDGLYGVNYAALGLRMMRVH